MNTVKVQENLLQFLRTQEELKTLVMVKPCTQTAQLNSEVLIGTLSRSRPNTSFFSLMLLKRGQLLHSRVLTTPPVLPPLQTGNVRMENPNPSSVLGPTQYPGQGYYQRPPWTWLSVLPWWSSSTSPVSEGKPMQNLGTRESGTYLRAEVQE